MKTTFIKVSFELDCIWEGLAPTYRIYVENELFAERTWNWTDKKLVEILQIKAPEGNYQVSVVPVGPHLAQFTMSNHQIVVGENVRWKNNTLLVRTPHES